MPIRPEHVFLYPIDWPQLSYHVRFVRKRPVFSTLLTR